MPYNYFFTKIEEGSIYICIKFSLISSPESPTTSRKGIYFYKVGSCCGLLDGQVGPFLIKGEFSLRPVARESAHAPIKRLQYICAYIKTNLRQISRLEQNHFTIQIYMYNAPQYCLYKTPITCNTDRTCTCSIQFTSSSKSLSSRSTSLSMLVLPPHLNSPKPVKCQVPLG